MTTAQSGEGSAIETILVALHRELQRVLGAQLYSVLLYGSRARRRGSVFGH
jgi:hypothetical protein